MRAGYHVRAGQQLLVKMAISYTSIEHARNNLDSELLGWNFDEEGLFHLSRHRRQYVTM